MSVSPPAQPLSALPPALHRVHKYVQTLIVGPWFVVPSAMLFRHVGVSKGGMAGLAFFLINLRFSNWRGSIWLGVCGQVAAGGERLSGSGVLMLLRRRASLVWFNIWALTCKCASAGRRASGQGPNDHGLFRAAPFCGHTSAMPSSIEKFAARRALSFAGSIVAFLLAVVAWPALAQSEGLIYTARVSHVFDGDTLWVRPSDGGRNRKLRIVGIDAPEICQEGGVAARDALRQRLNGQMVTVHEHRRDTYGRPLVDLAQGSEDLGAWMVRQGWAWSYRWHDDPGPFALEEAMARSKQRGIFAVASAEEPRDFRRRHGPCQRR